MANYHGRTLRTGCLLSFRTPALYERDRPNKYEALPQVIASANKVPSGYQATTQFNTLSDDPDFQQVMHSQNLSELFPMDGNDQYGDCTVAAVAHGITVWHGMIADSYIPSEGEVVDSYMALTGHKDQGIGFLMVLNRLFWCGLFHEARGARLSSLGVRDKNHIQQAIRYFGVVFICYQCQTVDVDHFHKQEPFTWHDALSSDYHSVCVYAYDPTGVDFLTWGGTQHADWRWWDHCVREVYTVLPTAEATSGQFSGPPPAELRAYLRSMRLAQLRPAPTSPPETSGCFRACF